MAARRVVCATGHPCRRTCASTRRTFRGPATQLDPHPQADTGLGRDPPPTTPVSHASDKIGLNLSDCPIGGGGDCCADGRGAGAATRCPAPHPESVCPTHSALRLWLVLVAQIIRGAWRRREAPHTHTHTSIRMPFWWSRCRKQAPRAQRASSVPHIQQKEVCAASSHFEANPTHRLQTNELVRQAYTPPCRWQQR